MTHCCWDFMCSECGKTLKFKDMKTTKDGAIFCDECWKERDK